MREFCYPKLNLEAQNYCDLIDWEQEVLTEPPLTIGLSIEEIRNLERPDFMCHTQDVERLVHLVSRVAKSSTDESSRLANAFIIIEDLKNAPKAKTKKDFIEKFKNLTINN